jgi:hypothetical protein
LAIQAWFFAVFCRVWSGVHRMNDIESSSSPHSQARAHLIRF